MSSCSDSLRWSLFNRGAAPGVPTIEPYRRKRRCRTCGVIRPGVVNGFYPQKIDSCPSHLERWLRRVSGFARKWFGSSRFNQDFIVSRVNRYQSEFAAKDDCSLDRTIADLRFELVRFGLNDERVARSFALIREIAARCLGKRHYDVQLFGGWILINGMIAEMETGEGKTLTAALASATAALAGIPVHVITANDYLAERDAHALKPLYERLGLKVAAIVEGLDDRAGRAAYACDVVYTTNRQVAFDYLRDRMEIGDDLGPLRFRFKQIRSELRGAASCMLRGLCFAIVDEVDSVLIDEARTPLVISRSRQDAGDEQVYHQALSLAEKLVPKLHFILHPKERSLSLTRHGKSRLDELCSDLCGVWVEPLRRHELVRQALIARHFFHRDQHYIVEKGKVRIVDEHTGRCLPGRVWEQGLQQLIEAREGCPITSGRDVLASISYQRFFRRYLHLAGMSGTVEEAAGELAEVYGLRVVKVLPNRPGNRIALPDHLYPIAEMKWQHLIQRVKSVHHSGQPVLIGTRTVSESEYLSRYLKQEGLVHRVLNARQDQQEARTIAQAGKHRSITVATNMAGRGTDIQLGEGVAELGGLHVIATQKNSSRRIDRQLFGRCARQGDPGSIETFSSLGDSDIVAFYPPLVLRVLAAFTRTGGTIPQWLSKLITSLPQKRLEREHRRLRYHLMKMDEQMSRTLALTGRLE